MIKNILVGVGIFIGFDILLNRINIQGRYYFNHIICNSIVVYNTFNSMLNCYNICNITNINNDELYFVKCAVYSLHIYHFLWYYKKLRRDDWMHHILMIGLVLPLSDIIPQHNIISHGLFFTTGLPGLIDYSLLFLNRNNIVSRNTEKELNTYLNVWIRAPGCIMNTSMGINLILLNYNTLTQTQIYGGIIMSSLIFWNGVYFMQQTLIDYIRH